MIYLKKLLNSTVLGAALGVLLVGYAVFAFDPPTQAPPGGNVPAPINTGTSNQTKAGGLLSVFNLWVNSGLGVTGGATFGGSVGIGTVNPGSALDIKGILSLSGSTSGYVGLAPSANAGSTTYILPSADGTPGQVLATDGSGRLYWTDSGAAPAPGQQEFISSGTFTVPAGVTNVAVTLVGGGGSGGGGNSDGWNAVGGQSGDNGEATSFGVFVTAGGGQGGRGGILTAGGTGGTSGGAGGLNGASGADGGATAGPGGTGGSNIYGSIGGSGGPICPPRTAANGGRGGIGYGAGGGGGSGDCGFANPGGGSGGGGGSGAVIKDFAIAGLTPGTDIPVMVGGAGSGGSGSFNPSTGQMGGTGASGVPGYVLVRW